MIRYQKMFFPSHKDEISIGQCLVIEIVRIEGFRILTKRVKFTLKQMCHSKQLNVKYVAIYSLPNVSYRHLRRHPIFLLKKDIFD